MCLEAQDPNPQQDRGGDLQRVCRKRQFDQTVLSFEIVHGDFEGEKSRKGLRQEDQFSVIYADFTFGLSRSRFQSPTTVTACHSRNSLSRPNAAQESTKTNFQGQMGGSPKASLTASGRGNQPVGRLPESNRGCPGPNDNVR